MVSRGVDSTTGGAGKVKKFRKPQGLSDAVLYPWLSATPHIKSSGVCYLAEGFCDALALSQLDFHNRLFSF